MCPILSKLFLCMCIYLTTTSPTPSTTLAWPFFWFENSFCHSNWSKKKGKPANASLRPIVGSKKAEKKSSWVALEYTRTQVRSIKRRPAPAAWSTGRRPPRDRGCEMTFETEGRNRRGSRPRVFIFSDRELEIFIHLPFELELELIYF